MKIAIEGCAHGELEKIYETIEFLEKKEAVKVDLLICCGDFQSTRNMEDLRCMACPIKYQKMCSFYKYYSGEKIAPILTIFIGGNHEASNYLQELAYGGWVAPNIYYLGYAGIVNVAGVRIGGLSGIYKGHDYLKGHHEKPPYERDTQRSAYHIRNLEVFRLKQIKQPIDIFISHDWPRGVYHHGDLDTLLKIKPFFTEDVNTNKLGSRPSEELLYHLKPSYWFAAHLHCKFAARIQHSTESDSDQKQVTKFLALDKCLPKRDFLQVIDLPHNEKKPVELEYDAEWLAILFLTNHLLSIKPTLNYMPGPGFSGRWNFTPTVEEMETISKKFSNDFRVPTNFTQTATPFNPQSSPRRVNQASAQINPQTMYFCERLGIDDPMSLLVYGDEGHGNPNTSFINEKEAAEITLVEDQGNNITYMSLDGEEIDKDLKSSTPNDDQDDESSTEEDSLSDNNLCTTSSPVQICRLGRRELSLPSPKISIADQDESVQLLMCKRQKEGASQEEPSGGDDLSATSTEPENENTPVLHKKVFKRRNQSIYSSTDDE